MHTLNAGFALEDESASLPEQLANRGIVTYLEIIRSTRQLHFTLRDLEMLAEVAKHEVHLTLTQAEEILKDAAAEAIANEVTAC